MVPELGILEALCIESFWVLVRREGLNVSLSGLPDELSVEGVTLLFLLFLLPELFCHL